MGRSSRIRGQQRVIAHKSAVFATGSRGYVLYPAAVAQLVLRLQPAHIDRRALR